MQPAGFCKLDPSGGFFMLIAITVHDMFNLGDIQPIHTAANALWAHLRIREKTLLPPATNTAFQVYSKITDQ